MGFSDAINNAGNTVLGATSTVARWKAGDTVGALQTGANTMAQSGLPGSKTVAHLTEKFQGIANNVRGISDMASLFKPQQQHQLAVTA